MMRENQKKLDGLIQEVMAQMHSRKYGRKICSHYRFSFRLRLFASGVLTKRDTAICRLLLETGLQGIDVCFLKLKDIDWEKDSVSFMQNKTKKPVVLPLRATYGNAIADYILHECPGGDSYYVFLGLHRSGKSIYGILKKREEWAG